MREKRMFKDHAWCDEIDIQLLRELAKAIAERKEK